MNSSTPECPKARPGRGHARAIHGRAGCTLICGTTRVRRASTSASTRNSRRWRSVHGLPDDLGPAVEGRQDLGRWCRGQTYDDTSDALIAEALDAVQIFRGAPDRDRNCGEVTAGLGRHLSKLRQKLGDVGIVRAARIGDPAVAVAHRAPRAVRKGAADDDRWVRLLYRLRPGSHFHDLDDVAVIFRLGFGPNLLHCLDLLAHLLEAGFEDSAMALDLVLVPTAADAEQKPPARDMIDRGDELCGLDRVALIDEAHPGPDLQPLRCGRRRGQRYERVHHIVIPLLQLATSCRRRFARTGNVRMLGGPHRLEAARFERFSELGRGHRVIGEKHRRAKIHLSLHWSVSRELTCYSSSPASML